MANDNQKKQVPLRLSPKLYAELAAWAEEEFRSVNGQIEYLLTECVRRRDGRAIVEDSKTNRNVGRGDVPR